MWKRANNNSCARCDLAFDREASEPLRRLVERPRRRPSPAVAPAASGSAASPAAPAAVAAGQKRKLEPQQSVSESASDQCSPTKQSVFSELDLKPALPAQTPVKRESSGAMPVAAAAALAPEEQRLRAQPAPDGDRSRTTLLGPPLPLPPQAGPPAPSQPNGLQRSAGSAFEAVAANIHNNSNPQQDFLQQLIASASRAALANANPPQPLPQLPQLPLPPPQQQQQQQQPNLPLLMQLLQRFGAAGQPGAAAGAVLLNGPKPPLPPGAQHPFLSLPGVGLPAGFPGLHPNPLPNLPMPMALQLPGFPTPGLAGVPGLRPPPSLPGLPFPLDPFMHSLLSPLLAGGPPPLPNPMTNSIAAAAQLQLLNALSQSPLVSPLHQSLGLGGPVGPANGLNGLNNLGALSNLLLGQLAASAMAGAPPPVSLAAQLPPPPQPQPPPPRPLQALPAGAFLHSSTSAFTSPNAPLSNSSPQLPVGPLLNANASHNQSLSQSQNQSAAAVNASSTQSAFEVALLQNIMQTLTKSSLAPPPPPTASNALLPGGLKFPSELLDSFKYASAFLRRSQRYQYSTTH